MDAHINRLWVLHSTGDYYQNTTLTETTCCFPMIIFHFIYVRLRFASLNLVRNSSLAGTLNSHGVSCENTLGVLERWC